MYEVRKIVWEDKSGWGIFQGSDEWGDISDLKADRYLVIKIIK